MANNEGAQTGNSTGTSVDTIDKIDTPKLFKVIILNDDFTPMDFVVLVLRRFFNKSEDSATKIMLDVHEKGAGVAGIYTLENAEMKVMQVNQFSRMNQHPLKATLEEAAS
jgi:ATP-dependent Clp protease adaptor protein ClpS